MMVVAKCVKCGKEYELEHGEKPSNFQCECGGELKSKEIVSESIKTKKIKDKSDIQDEWNKQSKNKKLGIGILGICCVGLILLIVFGGLLSPDKTTTTANNKTFSGQGLTFDYPSSWTFNDAGTFTTPNSVSQNSGSIDNLGSLTSYASEDPAIPATLDAAAANIRQDVTSAANKKDITIGGVPGIEYEPTGGSGRVDVVFVKGGTLYDIWLNTNNYDEDQNGINMMINTMKIQ
jgi:DNA-directed RNA polymerase subunit RPC12/RpoP